MVRERTCLRNGYGSTVSGHDQCMADDDVDRESLEAEANVLSERELLLLLGQNGDGDDYAEHDPEGEAD